MRFLHLIENHTIMGWNLLTIWNSIWKNESIPMRFQRLRTLKSGGSAEVFECLDEKFNQSVVVKTPIKPNYHSNEVHILQCLMHKKLYKSNIVRFYGALRNNKYLVFEKLDINLGFYLDLTGVPMRLQNVRTVIKQMSVALLALKGIGVIHSDIQPSNIMLVDQVRKPFKVKLIDFSSACFRTTKHNYVFQQLCYRAPEIILGLPVSEALDIWSLGIVMAKMVFGKPPSSAKNVFRLLEDLIHYLGPPVILPREPTSNDPKNLPEILECIQRVSDECSNKTCYLDQVYTAKDNKPEGEVWKLCMQLLREMLTWDDKDRITPKQILEHPFITYKAYHVEYDFLSKDGLQDGDFFDDLGNP